MTKSPLTTIHTAGGAGLESTPLDDVDARCRGHLVACSLRLLFGHRVGVPGVGSDPRVDDELGVGLLIGPQRNERECRDHQAEMAVQEDRSGGGISVMAFSVESVVRVGARQEGSRRRGYGT